MDAWLAQRFPCKYRHTCLVVDDTVFVCNCVAKHLEPHAQAFINGMGNLTLLNTRILAHNEDMPRYLDTHTVPIQLPRVVSSPYST